MNNNYVIGLDFGTDSVRSVIVDSSNGKTLGSVVHLYKRWKEGKYCDPSKNQFRQHPLDLIEGMEITIRDVVKQSAVNANEVKAVCIDTTGSSPVPVDKNGTALSLVSGFENNPNAMMVLWKDHTAINEAEEINKLGGSWGGEDFRKFEGGIYSSEWFWAKILHIIRNDEKIKKAAWSWMEHCDLMPFILTGSNDLKAFKRSRCAAGHKAMWHESWGGLPHDDFLFKLDPYLVELKKNLYRDTYTSDTVAGNLSGQWADKLGLTTDTVVAVGTFDAHAGAVGAEADEFTLVRVMGTSTCDIIVSSSNSVADKTVKGICGQVDGSVIPGMIGLEAGQSAFGDVLAWFKDILSWPLDNILMNSASIDPALKTRLTEEIKEKIIEELSNRAEDIPPSESAVVALDWVNGRRTPDADQTLKSALMNISLGTTTPHIFRALVEAICFGAKKIVNRFEEEGVPIKSVVGIGGVAKKAPFIMQTLADVLNMPIKIAVSEQAPALGAAMYAAVAAGIHSNVHQAIKAMGNGIEKTFYPDSQKTKIYQKLFEKYTMLGEFVERKGKS
jgi:L-ribulokinase